MLLQTWLLFCATETVLCFTPGPAVLLVISMALARGGVAGLRATGILFTNAFYFILSATGVGAIILASWKLFFLIKWIGAAYLIWLGLQMILSRSDRLGHHPRVETGGRRSPFAHGVVTQGANPKALVFFTALLPQFVNPASAVIPQIAILGVRLDSYRAGRPGPLRRDQPSRPRDSAPARLRDFAQPCRRHPADRRRRADGGDSAVVEDFPHPGWPWRHWPLMRPDDNFSVSDFRA